MVDVLKIYREHMAAELSRPEIREEKEKLVSFFSAPPAGPSFSLAHAGFLIPALVLTGVFFFLWNLQSRVHFVQGPSMPIYRMFAAYMAHPSPQLQKTFSAVPDLVRNENSPDADVRKGSGRTVSYKKPRVVVKRLSSRVGPTMVYQKVYRKTPVTIVWVFTPGGYS